MKPPDCADWYTWAVVQDGLMTWSETQRADLVSMERAHLTREMRILAELEAAEPS